MEKKWESKTPTIHNKTLKTKTNDIKTLYLLWGVVFQSKRKIL